ncbi:MAG: hypothetical protein R3C03_01525 [Pirellulaceae bacterium]
MVLSASAIATQFLVNETASLQESAPAVAVVESSGDMVVAWTSYEQPGGDNSGLGVYVQKFQNDGTPISTATLVNSTQTFGDQFAPDVAANAAGDFIVVWQGQDSDGFGIFGQRYAASGIPIGSEFQLNTFETGEQGHPVAAMDNAGNFVVAWQSDGQDGSGTGIYARRFDSTGTPLELSEFQVNSVVDNDQSAPAIAMARGTGNFVVAWEGEVVTTHSSFEIFARLYDFAGNTLQSDFLVNATAAREQVNADVAMNDSGDMVFTWTTEGIPGSGSDIFAQRFNSTATAVGSEFQVNVATLQGQINSVVAMDASGDFLINWQSSHQDEFSWGIVGRAYDSNGVPLVSDFIVNTFVEEPQTSPAIASNTSGQTVAVWLGLNADHANAVHAQRFQLPGADFSTVGSELVLGTYLGLEDSGVSVSVDAEGEFFVTWQSYGEDGNGLSILGRRMDASGLPIGSAFVVNTTTTGNQMNPSVASNRVGNSVVVWESADQDGDGHGIFAQRFNRDGVPIGAEFQINTTTVGSQTQPAVAMNWATGEFTVVWQGPDGDGEGIFGQRFNANGTKLGAEFQVNQQSALAQVSPAISMNEAGQFAVVWVSDHRALFDPEDSEKSIFVQWYDSDGTFNGEEQLVHTIDTNAEAQEYPDVALDANGNMVIVWQSITQDGSAWGVFGRQLLANKTPVQAAEFQINQTTAENQRHATVASDAFGNFTVSWQSDLQDGSATTIVSRQFNSDGTPETDETIVNSWTLGPQILPATAMTPSGDFGIFWNGQGNGRTEGVHGRIFQEGFSPPPPHIHVTPNGNQFNASPATGVPQSFPAVAVMETTGNYVAAWTSFEQAGQDESGLGVYAQLFAPDGSPLSGPILVNDMNTVDDQSNPAVAISDNGSFVVVWQSLQQDGSGWGIFARQFAADGTPLGNEFGVNSIVLGDQVNPTVAMNGLGDFVVAWQGVDDDGSGIYSRRYLANGSPIDGTEFLVNPTTAGNQTAPDVVRANSDGRFLISWQSEVVGLEGEVDVNVLASLYDSAGGLLNQEFMLNTTTDKDQVGPRAAMGPLGEFVVAWTNEGQTGSGADVYARRFAADGTGLGNDFQVNDVILQGQQYPDVGIDADLNFIVSWQSSHQDGFSWGIFGKVYDFTGGVLANEFQVNTNIQGPQTNPAVSANSQGTAIVTWLGLDSTHQSAIHAQHFQLPQGTVVYSTGPEGEVILNNYAALEEAPAATAVDAAGNFVVTWQSYGEDGSGLGIFARRFDANGLPLGDAFLVNTTTLGNQSQPVVASDAAGNFTIAWQAVDQDGDGYGIFAQRYDFDGNVIGSEFQVNTSSTGHQTHPDIAMNFADGSSIIVWQGPDVSGQGIFGQRFDSSRAPVDAEFQVNNFTDLDQVSPTVSMNSNGQTAIAWVSDHRAVFDPTDTEKTIFVQWYDSLGVSTGDEVLVHSLNAEFEAQEGPDVAMDADGNFVIVWQSINQDGNTWGVFGQQFLSDKSWVHPIEFQINQTVLAPQRNANVAVDEMGNFVVAWQSHGQDTSGSGVYARAYDACGVAQTDEFLIPDSDSGPQVSPVLAWAPNGKLSIFWTGHGVDRVEGVHGRVYDVAVGPVPAWVLQGTIGNDVFLVDMSGDHFVVTINGVSRSLDICRASSLIIHGLAGGDTIRVTGSSADETAVLNPGSLLVSNLLLSLKADGVESIFVNAGTGNDKAYFRDSTGNDIFRSRPTFTLMSGPGFYNRVDGFDVAVGYATEGNLGGVGDQAFLMDSTGNDVFRGTPTFSQLTGSGFFNRANGFDYVIALAVMGDMGGTGDQAYFYDSAGNDFLRSSPGWSSMTDEQYFFQANGFDRVIANATNGNAGGIGDQARMFDSDGNDVFRGYQTFSVMTGQGFYNRANDFDRVFGYATESNSGGVGDQAYLNDSSGNDTFLGLTTYSILSGPGYYHRVSGFDRVVANSNNGNAGGFGDQAFLEDSAGNDTFFSTPLFSYMHSPTNLNRANGFDRVFANATNGTSGGDDRALMFDSILNDFFYGSQDFGTLRGIGFYNRATGFDSIHADGNAGGVDTLEIDSIIYSLTYDDWEVII